jgi:hypothetical protein
MRVLALSSGLLLVCAAIACGGSTASLGGDVTDGGGADAGGGTDAGGGLDAGGGSDAGGGTDAGGGADSGGSGDTGAADDGGGGIDAGDAGVDCNALAAEVSKAETEATKCCPTCALAQCGIAVQGLCCPISVTTMLQAKTFQAAVDHYKAFCQYACPATPCEIAPSDKCLPSGQCEP